MESVCSALKLSSDAWTHQFGGHRALVMWKTIERLIRNMKIFVWVEYVVWILQSSQSTRDKRLFFHGFGNCFIVRLSGRESAGIVKIFGGISFLSELLPKVFHNTLWLAIIKARRIRYIGVRQELLKISIVGSRGM